MHSGRAVIGGVVIGLGAAGLGCASTGGGEQVEIAADSVMGETARWVEAAGVTFARDHRHVRYAITPSRSHDLLILEQTTHEGTRLTWLVEAPDGAEGVVEVGEGAVARGWVIEQPGGEKAHVRAVYGEVVVDSEGDEAVRATVHLSVTRRSANAGEVIAPSHTVWGEYDFEWMAVAAGG